MRSWPAERHRINHGNAWYLGAQYLPQHFFLLKVNLKRTKPPNPRLILIEFRPRAHGQSPQPASPFLAPPEIQTDPVITSREMLKPPASPPLQFRRQNYLHYLTWVSLSLSTSRYPGYKGIDGWDMKGNLYTKSYAIPMLLG